MAPEQEDPEAEPELAELPEDLQAALDRLPSNQRLVLLLVVLEGFTHQETAAILDISESTVRDRLYRAKDTLRTRLHSSLSRIVDANAGRGSRGVTAQAVAATVNQLTPELIRHLQQNSADLGNLPPKVIEELVAEFLVQRGFSDVALVGTNPETSADIYAVYHITPIDDRAPFFIEVKRWKEAVGINVINSVYGAMLAERSTWGWRAALIVSLAGFTQFRRTTTLELENLSVILKDKNDLLRWLQDYELHPEGLWLPRRSTSASPPFGQGGPTQ